MANQKLLLPAIMLAVVCVAIGLLAGVEIATLLNEPLLAEVTAERDQLQFELGEARESLRDQDVRHEVDEPPADRATSDT